MEFPDDMWPVDPPRRSGCLIKSVVTLLSLALIAALAVWFLGDRVARPRIERQVAAQLVREYNLPSTPTVHFDGSPFLVKAAVGSIDRVTVRMGRLTSQGLTVDSVDFVADGLRFKPGEAMRGTGDVVADTVKATVRITAADLSTYLQGRGLPVTLTATGETASVSGSVTVLGVTANGTATGTISLAGSTLQFSPASVSVEGVDVPLPKAVTDAAFSFSVPIPPVAGLAIGSARVVDGLLVCDASATNYVLNRNR
jgi:LmeA-like phospholipid-binding